MNLTQSQETFINLLRSYLIEMYDLRRTPTKAGAAEFMGIKSRQYFHARLKRICERLEYDAWQFEVNKLWKLK